MTGLQLLRTELFKQKRNFLWKIVIFFPLMEAALVYLDLYLRRDYLVQTYAKQGVDTLWGILIQENHSVAMWSVFISMAVVVITAIVHTVEDTSGGWKYSLSLPVRRGQIYLAKWVASMSIAVIVIVLNSAGLILAGLFLRADTPLDAGLFLRYILLQSLAVIGIVSLQQFLNHCFKNIILPVSIGIGSNVVSLMLMTAGLSPYIPYAYVYPAVPGPKFVDFPLWGSVAFGLFFFALGLANFSRKDLL